MDIDWWHPPIVDLTSYYGLNNTVVHCMDLSKVHPIISGNKFYKLWGHLEAFKVAVAKGIISMGGPHSNHLHALSYYCHMHEIPFIALVRQAGTDVKSTPTCKDLEKWGSTIIPVNPEDFRNLRTSENFVSLLPSIDKEDWFWISEGGKGDLGDVGLKRLFSNYTKDYSTIYINVGTGTSLLSLLKLPIASAQEIIGIAPFKKVHEQENDVFQKVGHQSSWKILPDPWDLGFGKVNQEIISFAKDFQKYTNIVLDYIYTCRLFYAFDKDKRLYNSNLSQEVLLIHGGGLQGNRAIEHVLS